MGSFRRLSKYLKAQWGTVTAVILTAVIGSVLFSMSFMTVIPLLKVMMGEEGLHGWIDRNVCIWRYGVRFYVPDNADLNKSNSDIANYLLVTKVKKESKSEEAGLKEEDRIVGVGSALVGADTKAVSRGELFKELAGAPQQQNITIQTSYINQQGELKIRNVTLNTGIDPWYISLGVRASQRLISYVPREITGSGKEKGVFYIIILISVVTVLRCISTFYQKYLGEKVVQVAIADLREDAFKHVMLMPMGYFGGLGTNDAISRLVNDIGALSSGLKVVLGKALREPMNAIFCFAGAMMLSPKLTLIFATSAPGIIIAAAMLGRKIKKSTKRSLMSSSLMLGRLEGAMNALPVVKVYNRQEHEHISFQSVNRRFLKQSLRISKIDSGTAPVLEVLGLFAGSAALLMGVHWVVNANMQASSFFGLLILLGTSAEAVRKSSDIWNKIQSADGAAERVFAMMDEPEEDEKAGAIELLPLKERLEFRNVSFTYPRSERKVLSNINLSIKAGETVAVVGPDGSGKTTLVNLIPRFYNVDSGQIFIDGKDIYDGTLKSLRGQISMVTQNVVTFNDTIAANIAYGKADATREEIIEAAKSSYADEFIVTQPEGYDTVIGEHGTGLSGGQLQRIVIARAILKNPRILIFDEAMSQVDADSEAKIHKALAVLMKNRTCFVVAHRFSTVISADRIVVLDDGKVIAQGTHQELVRNCGIYQNLYETQLIVAD